MEHTLRDKKERMNRKNLSITELRMSLELMETDCRYLKQSDEMMTIIFRGSEI